MCGRFVLPDEEKVGEFWRIDLGRWQGWFKPRYNVAPTCQVPIIVPAAGGRWELKSARWGLIPAWWNKNTLPTLSFNARSEEVAAKPMWRESLKTSRCLLPAQGWYEWNANQPVLGKSGPKGGQPYFISCPGAEVLAFAGLWSVWQPAGAAPVVSCALLTKTAAPGIAFIHPRMPAVLRPEQQAAWLNPATHAAELSQLIANAEDRFAAHPVSTRVNNVRNDSPDLLQRVPLHTMDALLTES